MGCVGIFVDPHGHLEEREMNREKYADIFQGIGNIP